MRSLAADVVLEDAPPRVPEGWEKVTATYLDVWGTPDSLPVRLALSRHGSESLPRIGEDLGVAIGRTVHVVLAPTERAFFEMQPGGAPEWADGTAYPSLGQVFLKEPVIRGTARPLEQVLDHELVHVLLGRAFAPQTPPRWLQEGVAVVYSGEHGPDAARVIAKGAAAGGLLSLDELTAGFPSDPGRAQLAYAQSGDFVAYLRAEYGDDAVREVVAAMRGGADVRAALRKATGLYLEDLDRQWRLPLERSGSAFWLSSALSQEVWWFGAASLAAVGLVMARARIRRRLDRLRREEAIRDELLGALWRDGGGIG